MRRLMVVACVLTVAACSREAAKQPALEGSLVQPSPTRDAASAEASAGAPVAAPRAARAVTAPMLAYAYSYELEAPAAKIPALAAKHEAACAAAGAAVCQVTGSSVRGQGRDEVEATLSLRASPGWIRHFREGLAADMKGSGGRVAGTTVDSDDLTRQIVDTEAALRAKLTLRDRLQAILASRPGKLSELLEVEKALAEVQGEIDASQSELAVMRTRVQTSALTLQYRSHGAMAPEGVGSPLKRAVNDVVGILALTVAAMVRIFAWLLPWALVAGAVAWLFRKRIAAARARRRKAPPPLPAMDEGPDES